MKKYLYVLIYIFGSYVLNLFIITYIIWKLSKEKSDSEMRAMYLPMLSMYLIGSPVTILIFGFKILAGWIKETFINKA